MTDVITFSIITPSYNQGEFLAETIESVIGQQGEFAIDYIIVDGGSTDDSVRVIRNYQDRLDRGEWPIKCRGISYRWLSEKDQGQTDALVKGFAMAKGEVFAWLNSDDFYLPGTLAAAAAHLSQYPDTALLYGDARYCDPEGAVIGRYRTEPFDYPKLAWFNFICQPSTFFRKDVFHEVGGLDPSLHFSMDYDLWIRIGKAYTCRYLPQFLSMYRLHEASKTVRNETLLENSEEAIRVTLKHFGWAPLTRVYNSSDFWCRSRLPGFLVRNRAARIAATVLLSVLRSLWLNKAIRRGDLKLLKAENFRKLLKSRLEIMTTPR
jgi:glycosyltransferase involved in cell wall biosynthesis